MSIPTEYQSLQREIDGLNSILDAAPDLIFRLDRQLRHLYVNQRVLDVTGLTREQYLGKTNRELQMPEDLCALWEKTFLSVFSERKPQEIEFTYPAKKGPIHYHMRVVPEGSLDGTVKSAVGITRDITERKQAEEALRESEKKFRMLYEDSPRAYQALDENGHLLEVNDTWCRILGYSKEEVVGKSFGDFLHPDWIDHFKDNFQRFKAVGEVLGVEFEMVKKNGSTITVAFDGRIGRDPRGNFQQTHCVLDDITERKQAEDALIEKQQWLELTQTAAGFGTYDWDIASKSAKCSPMYFKIFGVEAGDGSVAAEEWLERVHVEDRARAKEEIDRLLASGSKYSSEYRIVKADGDIRFVHSAGELIRDDKGQPQRMIGAIRDITERKYAEDTLKKSETESREKLAEIEAIYSSAPIGMCVFDRGLRFVRINERLAEINGLTVEEHMGRTPQEIVPAVTDFVEELAERIFRTGKPEFDVEISGETKSAPGITRFWVEQWLPLKNSTGEVVGINVVAEEITERKRSEEALRKAHDELERKVIERTAQLEWKNRELQEFASVASHDLQEPLRKIQAFGDMLQHELSDGLSKPGSDYLSRMRDAANRMQQLIKDLLAYSRVSTKTHPFERVDMKWLAERVADDMHIPQETKKPIIEIGELPEIDADPIQLSQLLQNLLGNAIRYSKNGETPKVEIHGAEIQPSDESEKNFCEIRVQDNGIGFDIKYLEKIFQPFERLHGRGEYEGTGIGLAICRKIVERHGGTITAESEPGKGSTFIVRLPMRQT